MRRWLWLLALVWFNLTPKMANAGLALYLLAPSTDPSIRYLRQYLHDRGYALSSRRKPSTLLLDVRNPSHVRIARQGFTKRYSIPKGLPPQTRARMILSMLEVYLEEQKKQQRAKPENPPKKSKSRKQSKNKPRKPARKRLTRRKARNSRRKRRFRRRGFRRDKRKSVVLRVRKRRRNTPSKRRKATKASLKRRTLSRKIRPQPPRKPNQSKAKESLKQATTTRPLKTKATPTPAKIPSKEKPRLSPEFALPKASRDRISRMFRSPVSEESRPFLVEIGISAEARISLRPSVAPGLHASVGILFKNWLLRFEVSVQAFFLEIQDTYLPIVRGHIWSGVRIPLLQGALQWELNVLTGMEVAPHVIEQVQGARTLLHLGLAYGIQFQWRLHSKVSFFLRYSHTWFFLEYEEQANDVRPYSENWYQSVLLGVHYRF